MEDVILILVVIGAFVIGYFVIGRFGRMVDQIRRMRFFREDGKAKAGNNKKRKNGFRRCSWCFR